jgi:hypothetical protein
VRAVENRAPIAIPPWIAVQQTVWRTLLRACGFLPAPIGKSGVKTGDGNMRQKRRGSTRGMANSAPRAGSSGSNARQLDALPKTRRRTAADAENALLSAPAIALSVNAFALFGIGHHC